MKDKDKEENRSSDNNSTQKVKSQHTGKSDDRPSSEGQHGEIPGRDSAEIGNRRANQSLGNTERGKSYNERHDELTKDDLSDRQEAFKPGDESTITGAPDDSDSNKDKKKK